MIPIKNNNNSDKNFILGEKQGFLIRLFGCSHERMSKPVTNCNVTYQYCSECGARRQYDINNFKPFGAFYNPEIGNTLYYI